MIGDNIRRIRKAKNISINKLSEKSGVALGYLSEIENNSRSNPSKKILAKISSALDVPLERLLLGSAYDIIQNRLNELGMSTEELAEKSNVPLDFIKNIDNIIPEEWDYEAIERIARALSIHPLQFVRAFAIQAPSEYNSSVTLAEENLSSSYGSDNTTVAAHHDGEDWTEEELREIENFKDYIRNKRNKK